MTILFIKFTIVCIVFAIAVLALTILIGWIAGDGDDDTWRPFP